MAQVLALTFESKFGESTSSGTKLLPVRSWLTLAVFGLLAFLIFAGVPQQAQAACSIGPVGTITCADNQVGGVDYHNPPDPYTTVNVNNLSTDIDPASGTPGIRLIGQGANPGSASCHVSGFGCEGNPGGDGGAAPRV